MLFLIMGLGMYEAFAGSAGGALIQLSTSHVPTPEEIRTTRVYGMNNQEEDENDNSPYGSI
jgi:hypothetical protein